MSRAEYIIGAICLTSRCVALKTHYTTNAQSTLDWMAFRFFVFSWLNSCCIQKFWNRICTLNERYLMSLLDAAWWFCSSLDFPWISNTGCTRAAAELASLTLTPQRQRFHITRPPKTLAVFTDSTGIWWWLLLVYCWWNLLRLISPASDPQIL